MVAVVNQNVYVRLHECGYHHDMRSTCPVQVKAPNCYACGKRRVQSGYAEWTTGFVMTEWTCLRTECADFGTTVKIATHRKDDTL